MSGRGSTSLPLVSMSGRQYKALRGQRSMHVIQAFNQRASGKLLEQADFQALLDGLRDG